MYSIPCQKIRGKTPQLSILFVNYKTNYKTTTAVRISDHLQADSSFNELTALSGFSLWSSLDYLLPILFNIHSTAHWNEENKKPFRQLDGSANAILALAVLIWSQNLESEQLHGMWEMSRVCASVHSSVWPSARDIYKIQRVSSLCNLSLSFDRLTLCFTVKITETLQLD